MSCSTPNGERYAIRLISHDNPTARPAPSSSARIEWRYIFCAPETDASDNPRMGDMSGATSIAPIMTAAELVIKPNVAIVQERKMSKK